MYDEANEALKNWKSLLPVLKPLIRDETKSTVRRKKMNVASLPNGSTIGVCDPTDGVAQTINIPYQPACNDVLAGQSVWVEWVYNNFSTAIAVTPGDGIIPASSSPTDLAYINGVLLAGNLTMASIKAVYYDTTAHWNAQTSFVPIAGAIVIYSDYARKGGKNVPNIKIGDGNAYLVDLPFVSDDLRETVMSHISNTTVHITAEERTSWNNKVTCYAELISGSDYTVVFTKD